eukprot:5913765-Pyramimonas_sp.AAC.1
MLGTTHPLPRSCNSSILRSTNRQQSHRDSDVGWPSAGTPPVETIASDDSQLPPEFYLDVIRRADGDLVKALFWLTELGAPMELHKVQVGIHPCFLRLIGPS